MSLQAELGSLATSLDELAARLTRLAEGLTASEADAVGSTLFEVERGLKAASRRLAKAVDEAG